MSTRITFQGLERAPGLTITVFDDGAINCMVPERSISKTEYIKQSQSDGRLGHTEGVVEPSKG